jgi:hypothetical protein
MKFKKLINFSEFEGLSFAAALRTTRIQLDLLTDIDMLQMVE